MYEFTVPEGDWDYDPKTKTYTHKDLVFTDKQWKQAKETIKDYISDGVAFTMKFVPKGVK